MPDPSLLLLGRMGKQPLVDVICPLIYVDSFPVTSTLSAFIYSVCLCDRASSWLAYSIFTLLSFLLVESRYHCRQPNKQRNKKKKKKGEKGTISPYFLILLVAMGDNLSLFCSVKNIKRNQMEFLGRFCFLDVDIALSSFWPFLFHSWKLHMMTGTGAATLHH